MLSCCTRRRARPRGVEERAAGASGVTVRQRVRAQQPDQGDRRAGASGDTQGCAHDARQGYRFWPRSAKARRARSRSPAQVRRHGGTRPPVVAVLPFTEPLPRGGTLATWPAASPTTSSLAVQARWLRVLAEPRLRAWPASRTSSDVKESWASGYAVDGRHPRGRRGVRSRQPTERDRLCWGRPVRPLGETCRRLVEISDMIVATVEPRSARRARRSSQLPAQPADRGSVPPRPGALLPVHAEGQPRAQRLPPLSAARTRTSDATPGGPTPWCSGWSTGHRTHGARPTTHSTGPSRHCAPTTERFFHA